MNVYESLIYSFLLLFCFNYFANGQQRLILTHFMSRRDSHLNLNPPFCMRRNVLYIAQGQRKIEHTHFPNWGPGL